MIVETTAYPNGNGINDSKYYSVNMKTKNMLIIIANPIYLKYIYILCVTYPLNNTWILGTNSKQFTQIN